MRDPSDLLNTLESPDERLDRALRKLAGLDQLVKEGRSHHLMPGLTKASIPDPLFTTPDVGGAQATFTKGLMTQPASSSSIRDSSIFSSFSEDSLREFDASQEFARQVVHTSRTPALSFPQPSHSLSLPFPKPSHFLSFLAKVPLSCGLGGQEGVVLGGAFPLPGGRRKAGSEGTPLL